MKQLDPESPTPGPFVPAGEQDFRALGIDFGSTRIGVAICDSAGLIAAPLETIHRRKSPEDDYRRIVELIEEAGAVHVVVGMPFSLDGGSGPAVDLVRAEIEALAPLLPVHVSLHSQDERFTTVTAGEAMKRLAIKPKRRKQIVDQIAAAVILQTWLDGRAG